MLADLNIARKLSLLLFLPMATFLFLVTVESMQRWKDIEEVGSLLWTSQRQN